MRQTLVDLRSGAARTLLMHQGLVTAWVMGPSASAWGGGAFYYLDPAMGLRTDKVVKLEVKGLAADGL